MRSPPADLTLTELAHALDEAWNVRAASIEYIPEGGGSHHWRVVDDLGRAHFVTVDDLDDKTWFGDVRDIVVDELTRALRTSAALFRDAGLDFVVAPLATLDGDVLHRVSDRYTVSLFPYLVGRSHPFGPYTDALLRARGLAMAIALHDATAVVEDIAPRHAPTFGGRDDLEAALDRPTARWTGGPHSEPAHQAFAGQVERVAALVRAFDLLAARTESARDTTVVTHGEPHPGNVMSVDDRVLLIDWDTVALAPPERDLWLITTDPDDLARYEQATGRRLHRAVLTLYEARWYLDDLGSVVRTLRRSHDDTADTRRMLDATPALLARLDSWLERLRSTEV